MHSNYFGLIGFCLIIFNQLAISQYDRHHAAIQLVNEQNNVNFETQPNQFAFVSDEYNQSKKLAVNKLSAIENSPFLISVEAGNVPFNLTGKLEQHFEENGFNDQSFSQNNIQHFGEKYPQKKGYPIAVQLTCSFRLNEESRMAAVAGLDPVVNVTGFDQFVAGIGPGDEGHLVNFKFTSWYIATTYKYLLANGRLGLTAGPSINFQSIRETDLANNKKKTIGGVASAEFRFSKSIALYSNFRWLPKVHFNEHAASYTQGGNVFNSILPLTDVNPSYISFGLSANVNFESFLGFVIGLLDPPNKEY